MKEKGGGHLYLLIHSPAVWTGSGKSQEPRIQSRIVRAQVTELLPNASWVPYQQKQEVQLNSHSDTLM